MITIRFKPILVMILFGSLILTACGTGSSKPNDLQFQFSCVTPSGDACENHYGIEDQQCASVDKTSQDKCPESYQGNQAVGVCFVNISSDINLEWVPYSIPPAIDPVGECENILTGVWLNTYTP